jgi:hypothetical protein
MELWIRSQDRHKILKVNEVYVCKHENNHVYADGGIELGEYVTKQRALEVLDEIQKYLLLPNVDNSNYVYEMPEE